MPGIGNTIVSNQQFVEVCGKRFLTGDFLYVEDDTKRTQSNGGPCYRVILSNKPAIEFGEPGEVKLIAEWFRNESLAPNYLAIAPSFTMKQATQMAHAGGPQVITGEADAPVRKRPGRKPGVKAAKTQAATAG
jgi:hypothetical protein